MKLTVSLNNLVADLVFHCWKINCPILQLAACPNPGFGKVGKGQVIGKWDYVQMLYFSLIDMHMCLLPNRSTEVIPLLMIYCRNHIKILVEWRGGCQFPKWYKNGRSNKALEFKESEAFSQLGRTWWEAKSGFSCRGTLYNSSYFIGQICSLGSWRHGQPRLEVIPQHGRDSQIALSVLGKVCDSRLLAESDNLSTGPQTGQTTLHSLLKPPDSLSFVTLIWK